MAAVLAVPHSPTVPPDLERLVRRVRDQGQTSACVGCAIASALDIRQRALGLNLNEPSALALYAAARASDGQPQHIIADTGCRAVVALKVARDMGVPRELDWPFASPVNRKPSWKVWSNASAVRASIFGRSISDVSKRVDEVSVALHRGFPVLVGFETDETFENLSSSEIMGAPEGPNFGGHMVLIVREMNPFGIHLYRVLNSWGEGWCDGGFFNANEIWLRNALEVRVCEVTP